MTERVHSRDALCKNVFAFMSCLHKNNPRQTSCLCSLTSSPVLLNVCCYLWARVKFNFRPYGNLLDKYNSNLTFRGPCIVIYSYNKSQQDAIFLNFILVKNSPCFGQTYCPSSGVLILYSQQLVFVILHVLTASEDRTSLADSQHNSYDLYQLL